MLSTRLIESLKSAKAPGRADHTIPWGVTTGLAISQYSCLTPLLVLGNCWDNAVVESFFHTLKTEHVYHQRSRTRDEARQDIFEWIEVFYTRVRRHSTLGYCSPAEFEAKAMGS